MDKVWVVGHIGAQIVNPSGAEQQLKGAVLDGLGQALGQQITINWNTSGLTRERPVAIVNAGGGQVDNFVPDVYQTSSDSNDYSFTNAVDTSGVSDPAPAAVYQSYTQAAYNAGNACVDNALEDYLIDWKVPRDGLAC